MQTDRSLHDIRIVDFPHTNVAVLEHRGDPKLIGDSIRTFIAWRKQQHLHPSRHATFNIFHDDNRIDLCVAVDAGFSSEESGILSKTLPAGRCAKLRHIGSDDHLPQSISYLCSQWLPQSGEKPRDFPLFVQRVRFYPDVPENEAIVDIFLPLQ